MPNTHNQKKHSSFNEDKKKAKEKIKTEKVAKEREKAEAKLNLQ